MEAERYTLRSNPQITLLMGQLSIEQLLNFQEMLHTLEARLLLDIMAIDVEIDKRIT